MNRERPWWLPTAVFVAPVCVAAVAALWLFDPDAEHVPWPLGLLIFLVAFVWPWVDLARREGRHRASKRPPGTGPWPEGVDPRRVLVDALVSVALLAYFIGGTLAGIMAADLLGRESGPAAGAGVYFVLITLAFAAPRINRWRGWSGGRDLLRWAYEVGRRWPTTFGVLSLLLAALALGTMAYVTVGDGPGFDTIVGLLAAATLLVTGWNLISASREAQPQR